MRDGLRIRANWTGGGNAGTADRTSAFIAIDVAGRNACRLENRWSDSVDEAAHLSALPLALWFASSWWRLRWEGEPRTNRRSVEWRMAHEVSAAGGGFLWPNLTLASDGETMEAQCRASPSAAKEMFLYLDSFNATISADAFESGVDRFLTLVIERVGSLADHGLVDLWKTVLAERHDTEIARFRRVEALLGFDPDEAPSGIVDRLLSLTDQLGDVAMLEVAATCAGENPADSLDQVLGLAKGPAISGRIERIPNLAFSRHGTAPSDFGRTLANNLRAVRGRDDHEPIADRDLAGFLGLTERQLVKGDAARPRALMSLAITEQTGAQVRFIFRRRHAIGRRFEAARFLCDSLMRPQQAWHPASDASTAQQKVQRAFAAEFLAPIAAIDEYLQEDFSLDAIAGAAEYYDVSTQTVASQLANHHRIPRDHPSVPA